MVKIRTAKPEEIPEIVKIYRECNLYNDVISNENVTRRSYEKNPHMFLVAEEDNRLIGTVRGQSDGIVGLVWKLCVLSDHRRKGIAKALMKEILCRLRSDGCAGANLIMRPEDTSVMEYYQKQGWEKWVYQLMVFPDLTRIEEHYE